MQFAEIVKILESENLVKNLVNCSDGLLNVRINDIQIDSKNVGKGSLYICRKGYKFDSHFLASEVVRRGACALITERDVNVNVPYVVVSDSRKAEALVTSHFYGYPHEKLTVFGVTGTNGKTTIATLIHYLLNRHRVKGSLISTVKNLILDKAVPAKNTTPSSAEIFKIMYETLKKGGKFVSMEISSHALALHRVDSIKLDYAILTNITHDHLDFHGNFENYVETKLKIFDLLKATGKAVINADLGMKIDYSGHIITYGIENEADFKGSNIKVSRKGTCFDLLIDGKNLGEIHIPLIGSFNVYNVLAVLAVMIDMGYSLDFLKNMLKKFPGVEGRFELIHDKHLGIDVVIDFAHTPDALEKALKTAKQIANKRIIAVFGAGGEGDRYKRPIMGRIASNIADVVIITTDNPKSEDPREILEQIEEGVDKSKPYLVIEDRKDAIEMAVTIANKGDLILIAGKGHERIIDYGSYQKPFNDREVLEEILESIKERINATKAFGNA
ncbi:MAG: UDP-N-acetylmuramoyl-L-alanyl-D-glutamate--2,6-diaminopimelate ligase [Thermotogaceae bacterium]|nr:UDP-N-acetylmuramoyl-L-alanyl-D-glutamate--2,6-diaminopimelate ligase [Thermotogaceae bacterium]